ncbi:MAG: signal peptidase II [Planktomarina sp.]
MSKYLTWFAALTFALDQITKLVVVHWMDLINIRFIEVIPGFIYFNMTWNAGINFGLFASDNPMMRWLWVAVAVIVSVIIAYWMRKETNSYALMSAGLVIGGAIGNSFDRIIYGAVADFLNITCCGIRNVFSFNVADIAVFVGIFGLIVFSTDHQKT